MPQWRNCLLHWRCRSKPDTLKRDLFECVGGNRMVEKTKKGKVNKKMIIGDVVSEHPDAAMVMMKNGLHCVGCGVAGGESIEDGCRAHGMKDEDIDKMIEEMNDVVEGGKVD